VRHKSLLNTTIASPVRRDRSHFDLIPDLLKWLGLLPGREGFGAAVLIHDPFGWRTAMTESNRK